MRDCTDATSLDIILANYNFEKGNVNHYDELWKVRNNELNANGYMDPQVRLQNLVGKPPRQKRSKCAVKKRPQMFMLDHHEAPLQERASEPPLSEEESFLLADSEKASRFLHDSGCTHHAVDVDSPLFPLLYNLKPSKGHYLCGGGGEVKVLHTAKLKMPGYPKKFMRVKVTSGMGRNVFSATQAAVDGMEFSLSRKPNGELNAFMKSANAKFPLYEERKGGLLYLDAPLSSPNACYLAKDCTKRTSNKLRSLIWKSRLCHEGDDSIKALERNGHTGIEFDRLHRTSAVENFSNQPLEAQRASRKAKLIQNICLLHVTHLQSTPNVSWIWLFRLWNQFVAISTASLWLN